MTQLGYIGLALEQAARDLQTAAGGLNYRAWGQGSCGVGEATGQACGRAENALDVALEAIATAKRELSGHDLRFN